MSHAWQLQEAKNKFSKVVDDALRDGPQIITKHGVETAILLSMSDYNKLIQQQGTISSFFRNSPLADGEIDLSRDKSPIRSEGFE
jgi:antitoxin Phd